MTTDHNGDSIDIAVFEDDTKGETVRLPRFGDEDFELPYINGSNDPDPDPSPSAAVTPVVIPRDDFVMPTYNFDRLDEAISDYHRAANMAKDAMQSALTIINDVNRRAEELASAVQAYSNQSAAMSSAIEKARGA